MAAADLSKLSDEELSKIANSKPDVSSMSDDDLMKIAMAEQPNLDAGKTSRMDAAKIGVQRGVSLGFRPAIAGAGAGLGSLIGNLQQDVKGEGLKEKLSRSFGSIPSAYEEGRRGAVSEEAQAIADRPGYVMGGDVAGNILTSPLVAAKGLRGALMLGGAQGAGRAVSEAEDLKDAGGKFLEGVGYGAAGYGGGKLIAKGAQVVAPAMRSFSNKIGDVVGEKTKNALTKVASTLTGVSEQDIKSYAKHADEIAAMSKAADGSVSEAADQVREKFSQSLGKTRAKLNSEISGALGSSEKLVEAQPILEALASQKSKINPALYKKEVGQIDELIGSISALSKDGKVSVKDAHDIKGFLQDRASSAYGGSADPASLGTEAAKAAKSGAAIARKLVNEAEPAVANANNQLAQLHEITDGMNRNIFTVGKPEAALLAAGSGGNARNLGGLQELGKATGTDMVSEAQKLSAMRTFGSPQLLPMDTTGKAVARMATGAGAGTLIGGPLGSVVGAALTSPAALKAAIDTGRISKKVIEATLGKSVDLTDRGLAEVIQILNTPKGAAVFNQVLNQQKVAEGPMQRRMDKISNQQGTDQ